MHALPGMELAGADPARASSEVIGEYFDRYEKTFDLRVRRPVDVRAVREGTGGRLRVETSDGDWSTRALINATGTWDRPFWPHRPGQETFPGAAGAHGVVPGAGGVRRAAGGRGGRRRVGYPAPAGDRAVRGGHDVVTRGPRSSVRAPSTRRRAGRPCARRGAGAAGTAAAQCRLRDGAAARRRGPRGLAGGVLDRQPMFDRITPDGVEWRDGRRVAADAILWATGFRPAVGHLAPLRLREPGGGIRVEGTRAVADPRSSGRLRPLGEHRRRQPGRTRGGAGHPAAAGAGGAGRGVTAGGRPLTSPTVRSPSPPPSFAGLGLGDVAPCSA
ncbi:hypothetical protein GCM10023238_32180 [Streptomyces heliomycini]